MNPVRAAHILVDNVTANVAAAVGSASGSVLVDVSAGAYGHGVERVARAARSGGARALFVRSADEAMDVARRVPGLDVVAATVAPDRRVELESAGVAVGVAPGAVVLRDEVYGFDGVAAPSMRLTSRVLSTKTIRAGDGVSYGYTYRAPSDGRTALVGVGYGDGIHRHAGNRIHVLVDGELAPVVGRVAMNVFVVFLGERGVADGAAVSVFGDPGLGEPSLLEWSRTLDVEPASVTAGIGRRVERIAE